ncbi:MAG TPA: rhomboid family intramembrane serine protease [Bryobacteraceae bacterium]|nr:rhomboid family intramembrane serine protease [Bryobacteraceae bacterium]
MEKRRMCPQCRAFITTEDKICPYCNTEVATRSVSRRAASDALGGLIPHARFTTLMIMLINTGLYIATLLHTSRTGAGGMDPDGQTLFLFGAKYGPAIAAGQWWRLITAGFLHGGILHILMNMWVLFDLGAQVEEACGTSRFLVIYSVSNVTGFLASFYFLPSLSIGASAAIFGLIGAMIGVGVRDRSSYGSALRSFYMRWAIYGLILSLIPGTDYAAHIGGLAGGFAVGFIGGTPGYSAAVERAWQVAAGIALAITGLAFFEMARGLLSAS